MSDNKRFNLDGFSLELSLTVAWDMLYGKPETKGVSHWMSVPGVQRPGKVDLAKLREAHPNTPFYAIAPRLILFCQRKPQPGTYIQPNVITNKVVEMASYDLRKKRPDITTLPCTINELPGLLDMDGTIALIKSWLATADYGTQPDHDGDNSKGWRVYNEAWSRVDVPGIYSAFVAIEPSWQMHGK